MIRYITVMVVFLCFSLAGIGQNVTINVVNQPAPSVFRSLIEQTGKNFVYSSELLKDMKITVTAKDKPLNKVLDEIFSGTGIEYKIKGKDVVLKRKITDRNSVDRQITEPDKIPVVTGGDLTAVLAEVVVVSRLESPNVETAEIGARKVTADEVRGIPALFGEPDLIKTLHTQPGVTEGTEGMAGMYVHGGNADENMYMLDNVPLYHVNHFAGLFSSFNPDVIRYIDFFKSSMPAKFDGRLSSFMDVRLLNGDRTGHHGSVKLGLTSGSFNITGPLTRKTTYLFGLRRSWYDVFTIPALALINSGEEEKTRFRYYFMDLNFKVSHSFSNRATGFVSVYFGDDMLKTGAKDSGFEENVSGYASDEKYDYHWGNLIVQTGLNYRLSQNLSAEFTAAYTRYFSNMKYNYVTKYGDGEVLSVSKESANSDNNINDWIFRADFDWRVTDASRVRFGAGYVRHSFLPSRTIRRYVFEDTETESRDSTWAYGANELNAYIEDDWRISDKFCVNAGFHASLFNIDRGLKYGLSPRLSIGYRPDECVAIKAAYSHTTQYVHQLTQSYLALPTDQWIPVTGDFKPQTADKIAAGVYWQPNDNLFAISVECYYKWMHNLLDYRDEYYLKPPLEIWNARLTSGRGTAKGIDVKLEKLYGRLTGHISYSLAWADRTFADKNGGHTYPARFDNRHTINLLINWSVSDRVQLNASWMGHSGNRFTLMPQMWEAPPIGVGHYYSGDDVPLKTSLNNYQLPFYHRLDLSLILRNSRGYWTFGLYNAYNHMNTVAIRRSERDVIEKMPDGGFSAITKPVFQKVKLLPIIPSISYTWQF